MPRAVSVILTAILLPGYNPLIAPGRARRNSAGFSLLEMLVAVAILGMALAALYQAAGTATRIVAVDQNYSYATQLALSLLADNGEVPAAGLSISGETDGGFEWSVQASPVAMVEPAVVKEGVLQEIAVSVAWRDGARERDIVLHSIVAGREDL